MEYDKTLLLIMNCAFSINVAYALAAPFLPLEYESKGVPTAYLGITLSSYAVSFIFFSPILGAHLGRLGRRRSLRLGLFLLASSCFGYPWLNAVNDPTWFLAITIIFRIIQGVGASFTFVSSYSIANERYKEHIDTFGS